MKTLISKKSIVGLLGLCSFVLASTIRDMKTRELYHPRPENDGDETVFIERNVASDEKVLLPAIFNLPLTEENAKKINGKWSIIRLVKSDRVVAFDKRQDPIQAKQNIIMNLELIDNGIVKLDNSIDKTYKISMLPDAETIVIFKAINNGYEVIEASRIKDLSKVQVSNLSFSQIEEVQDLILERAAVEGQNGVLVNEKVSGELTLKQNMITNLSVTLHTDKGEQSIKIDSAIVKDAGSFVANVDGEENAGLLINNGKDGYRLSFTTGPLKGAMLSFVTPEQLKAIEEKDGDALRAQADSIANGALQEVNPEAVAASEETHENAVQERQIASEETTENPERALSKEEIQETAAQNGFNF
jgi:hypothetical protein